MGTRVAERGNRQMLDQTTVVRELHLKRRRSRVPWVYAVYHRHNETARTTARPQIAANTKPRQPPGGRAADAAQF